VKKIFVIFSALILSLVFNTNYSFAQRTNSVRSLEKNLRGLSSRVKVLESQLKEISTKVSVQAQGRKGDKGDSGPKGDRGTSGDGANIIDFGACRLNDCPDFDSTQAIQNALDASTHVHIPEGAYLVKSDLIIRSDQTIFGDGIGSTLLILSSTVQSGFRRAAIIPDAPNRYISNVEIRDIGIIMNEQNPEQIGFDMSHISRTSLKNI
jgi:hypothetical protein